MLKTTLPGADTREEPAEPVRRPCGTLPAAAPPASMVDYRLDIDGLRAVAVILNHIDHRLLPGGYLGVDVFFVFSRLLHE